MLTLVNTMVHTQYPKDSLQQFLSYSGSEFDIDQSIDKINALLDSIPLPAIVNESNEFTELFSIDDVDNLNTETLILTPPSTALKPLPTELKYVLLDLDGSHLVIISFSLDTSQEARLVDVIRRHRATISWPLEDLKGISPVVCSHWIDLEVDAKTSQEP